MKWRGVRLGVAAATTRGMQEPEMAQIGQILAKIWQTADQYTPNQETIATATAEVATLCQNHPTYRL